jgi:vacuolar-type H+-ATPase subunit C/Vma6
MKYILTLIAFLFVVTTTNAQQTGKTTADKEVLQDADYGYLLGIAKENIVNAELDEHRINTYRWYISFVPKKWADILTLWFYKYYPHLKNKKLN